MKTCNTIWLEKSDGHSMRTARASMAAAFIAAAMLLALPLGSFAATSKLYATGAGAGDNAEYDVAIHEIRAVVGAPGGQAPNSGTAHIFEYDAALMKWIDTQILSPPLFSTSEFLFGSAVALDNDFVVVSDTGGVAGGVKHKGVVHVYTLSGGQWSLAQSLTATSGDGVGFGFSLAIRESYLFVG